MRGDACRDPLTGLDRDREGRPERRLVALGHLLKAELVAALLGQTEADQATAVRSHEVDRFRSRELSRDRQIALVLAVGGVDDDHEPARADVLDRLLDGRERRLLFDLGGHSLDRTLAHSGGSQRSSATSSLISPPRASPLMTATASFRRA